VKTQVFKFRIGQSRTRCHREQGCRKRQYRFRMANHDSVRGLSLVKMRAPARSERSDFLEPRAAGPQGEHRELAKGAKAKSACCG
jgi:hypothetical protein